MLALLFTVIFILQMERNEDILTLKGQLDTGVFTPSMCQVFMDVGILTHFFFQLQYIVIYCSLYLSNW